MFVFLEQEAEVEEERLRKEREERDRQDEMTLGETKEQLQILNTLLKELRNEKQQLFLRLKKVLNEDEHRKKQQQQKDRYCHCFRNLCTDIVILIASQEINCEANFLFTVRCSHCKAQFNNKDLINKYSYRRVHRIN